MRIFIFGVLAYIFALIAQLAFTLYVGAFSVFGRNIDDIQTLPMLEAVIINIILAVIFGLQHSVMARTWLKKWITKIIPQASERSAYVLMSGFGLFVVTLFWQPIDGFLWKFDSGYMYYILFALYIFGWSFSVIATFVINHFELFGLQQVYCHLKGKKPAEIPFSQKFFYKYIRHPIQFGVIIGLFFAPTMSYSHLLLAILFTIYIFIGLYFEEKGLEKELGQTYKNYKKRVGMMFPKNISQST